ncbi:MAG TPA: alpha/beta hydrolase [Alphaproteobacteria bacterium]|nr:alpha/beta hydrolase [Alphaproteobacteria bacterium]
MNQAEIDAAYNPRPAIPDFEALIAEGLRRGEALRGRRRVLSGQRFGPTLDEYLDIYPADAPGAPIHLFFHGGYWRAFTAREFGYVAEGAVSRGVTAVIANYALAPKVRIAEIVRQARAALAWVWGNAPAFGGDPRRITVSGHSAGAQLAARLLQTDWPGEYGLPADIVKGACLMSGLYDLEPLRWSWLQPVLQLDAETVARESPQRHPPLVRAPVHLAVGGLESAAFHRQTANFAAALAEAGLPVTTAVLEGRHHLGVLDDLADPAGPLWRAVEGMI